MNILFTEIAWEDYTHWQRSDPKMLRRINELIRDAARDPYSGLGKPEPLKFTLAGCWSRRIDQEHRLVYKPDGDTLLILQCGIIADQSNKSACVPVRSKTIRPGSNL